MTSHELKNKIRVTLILSDQEINQNNINNVKSNVLTSLLNLKIKLELDKYKVDINQIEANNHLSLISSMILMVSKKNLEVTILTLIYFWLKLNRISVETINL